MKKNNLRISILQQAIEGKLVPQLAADGNAQDLVDNIREHKAELIREKKLKKDPNESYIYRDDEGHFMERIGKQEPVCIDENLPFVVPEGWTWARLGEIGEIGSAKRVLQTEWKSQGIPFLRAREIVKLSNNEKIDEDSALFISPELYQEMKCKFGVPQKSDIMISAVGSIGKTYIVKKDDVFYYKDASVLCIKNKYDFYSLYIKLVFDTSYLQKIIKDASKGTTVDTIVMEKANKFLLPLPPLAEQKRIVKKVEELMPLAEKFEKQSEELELLNGALPGKLRKSILQQAIEGKLVPQLAADGNAQDLVDNIREHKAELIREKKLKKDPKESYIYRDDEGHFMERIGKQEPVCIDENLPFAVPDGWTWARLGEMINLLSGRDLAPSEYFSIKSGIPYITGASNFKNGEIEINRWSNNPVTISHAGDLLITCKGTIGEMAYNNIGDVHIARQIMAISTEYINISYIEIILKSQLHNLEKKAKSMIPGISRDVLIDFLLPLPPLAEQERIVKKVEELMEKVDKMEKAMV